MLTKSDLSAIRQVIKEQIQTELKPLRQDIQALKPLRQDIQELKSDVKSVKKDITEIRNDLEMVTGEFDKEQVALKKRTDRIEKHLDLTPI